MACENTKFVFDFIVTENKKESPSLIANKNIFNCSKLLRVESPKTDHVDSKDYAVIQLDRKVDGRTPLKLRSEGQLNINDSVIMIGHPLGLPLKIAGNAGVRSIEDIFFRANLDAFGGNSGSPVINAKSLEVEGMLVDGEIDFAEDSDGYCYVSKKCNDNSCSGELSMLMSAVPF